MPIKTRESLRTIKTFDRAKSMADKVKSGANEVKEYSEELQNARYASETEYAGNQLETTEGRVARNAVYGVGKVGNWGIRTTQKNIVRWRNRTRKLKVQQPKQLPSAKRKALSAPKNAAKTAKRTAKTAKTTAKATAKAAKATLKAAKRAAQVAKKAAQFTVKAIKVAAKAIVAAVKATVAAIKGIVAAIAAGGWIAVLVIVIICMVALVVGSVVGVFVPSEDGTISIQSVMQEMNNEFLEEQGKLKEQYTYDYIVYDGEQAGWREVIAIYAVKLNLDPKNPQEVVTFDEDKAEQLRTVFRVMNHVCASLEEREETVVRNEVQPDGSVKEIQETVVRKVLHIISEPLTASEAAISFGFSDEQKKALSELLDSYDNDDMWAVFGE